MPTCFAFGCNHDSRMKSTGIKCKFFRFPMDKAENKKWNTACKRERMASSNERLCSCHFLDGIKENGPSIFKFKADKRLSFVSPEKRRRISRDGKTTEGETSLPGCDPDAFQGGLDESDGTQASCDLPQAYIPQAAQPSYEIPQPSHDAPQLSHDFAQAGPSSRPDVPKTSAYDEARIYFLEKRVDELEVAVERGQNALTFNHFKNKETLLYQYTGIVTIAIFNIVLQLIQRFDFKYYAGSRVTVESFPLDDQLLCTLMKLRLNCPMFDLAECFKRSRTTIRNVVLTLISTIHEIFFEGIMMNKIPSRLQNAMALPSCFATFPNTRIILDCTEVEVAIPSSLKDQKAVFSHYKQRHTNKVLIGIAPNASITFVSNLYPGSLSDKAITKNSKVLEHMKAGDLILCDKGFLIRDMCTPLGMNVNLPPFLVNPQFSREEVIETRRIARARIHVERAIGRLKSYRILDLIKPNLREHASKIVQVCAVIVNLQYSLLKESELLETSKTS